MGSEGVLGFTTFLFFAATITFVILFITKKSKKCEVCTTCATCEICDVVVPPKVHLDDYTKFELQDSSGGDLFHISDTVLPQPYDESAATICNNMKNCKGYGYNPDAGLIYFKSSLNEALNTHEKISFHVKNQINTGDATVDTAHTDKLAAYVAANTV